MTAGEAGNRIKDLEAIRWFHRVRLKDGRMTPGVSTTSEHEAQYLFDRIDFSGRSVLDLGCWDGKFTFLAEQRGASRCVGVDDPAFRYGGMDGWDFLHDHFQSRATWVRGSVYDLPPGRFDVILCYGLIYHLSDPLLALANVFSAADQRVAIEGNIFQAREPRLLLFPEDCPEPGHANIYAVSTGFISTVAARFGFEMEACQRRRRGIALLGLGALRPLRSVVKDRAAMLFRRVAEPDVALPAACFPRPVPRRG